MKRDRPVVLALFSDVHAGSTVAVCPPEGVEYDDGGRYIPSKPQVWLWEQWGEFWGEVDKVRSAVRGTLGLLCNGDAADGPGHHKTHQSISPNNAEAQGYVIDRVFSVPKALAPDWSVFIKGTASHVGQGADTESMLAKRFNAIKEPTTDAWSWYEYENEIYGRRIHATHHGRTGGRAWTKASALGILASEIMLNRVEEGLPRLDLAVRSHKHEPGDTGDQHFTRLLALPSWQFMTGFGYQVVPEKAVNNRFGGYIVIIYPTGAIEVRKHIYRPAPRPVHRPPT